MHQSTLNPNASLDGLSIDPARESQSFRGLMIGIAVSTVLWAPVGVVAMRLL